RIFIICSLIVLLLSFVIISLVTARLVRPLREMSAAAKSFAKGDFSKRVPVYDKDEIGQLASAFNNMASSLTSLEDMRRSFVANVSHELKTPMTSIAGFVDGILDGTIPPEQQNHYLHIVSDEIKRLSRLVRSLLDIASLEAGSFTFSKTDFDAAETIRRVLIGFEKQIDHKGLSVSASGLDDALLVNADPDITHRIIYNLIDNAVKFANDNGSIEINAAPSDGRLYIGIKNTGMGIPEKDLPFVFDRFYKTDKSRGLDRNGIGLGLYIVKSTLLLMGEDIVVKSVEGQFCEFVFTLKLI
ncbi:MAG: HAMP domain-containing sensor histidine kinase, partial [Clostridia bacterium]|nr:HAMP domain-containing sensor histidine kinase [Clostridia bacterium]